MMLQVLLPWDGDPFLAAQVDGGPPDPALMQVPIGPAIRVVVVSGDRIFREVLATSLASLAGLGVNALMSPPQESAGGADVVLIDVSCDPQAALAWTAEAVEQWPEAKVIAVGLDAEDESVDFAEAGAVGVVLKGATVNGLMEAIHAAHVGRTLCSPQVIRSVLDRIVSLAPLRPPAPPRAVETLTPREQEILALMAAGLGNKEAGRRLGITVQTVKNHVHRILAKLHVSRRREAVRLAYDLGLLAEPREAPLAGAGGPAGRAKRG